MTRLHYAGIDVHKETMDVLVYREGEQHAFVETTIPNRDKTVRKLFGKLLEGGSVIACYEAGCMGFGLQRFLEGMGVGSIVVAPGKVPRRSGDRVKTDRRDGVPRRIPFLWVKVPRWQLPVQPSSEECM